MNPLALILLLSVGGVLVASAAGAANVGSKSSIKVLNVDSLKLIGTEIEVSTTIVIDNPTGSPISIKKPYLRLFYSGKEIGNSMPSAQFFSVKANSRTEISKVNVRIPISSAPTLMAAILKTKKTDQSISIEVSTTVNGFNIKDTKEFKISDLV